MDLEAVRVSALRWVTTGLIAAALAAAIRTIAALLDVEVVVPRRGDTENLVPLDLGPIVVVSIAATVAAIVTVLVLDRLVPARSRQLAGWLAILVLLASLVPVVLADPPRGSLVTVVLMHVVVAATVIRGVIRPS